MAPNSFIKKITYNHYDFEVKVILRNAKDSSIKNSFIHKIIITGGNEGYYKKYYASDHDIKQVIENIEPNIKEFVDEKIKNDPIAVMLEGMGFKKE